MNEISFKKKKKKDKKEKETANEPDEEGWITVTNKSRKANLAMTERNVQKLKSKQKKKQKKMVRFVIFKKIFFFVGKLF